MFENVSNQNTSLQNDWLNGSVTVPKNLVPKVLLSNWSWFWLFKLSGRWSVTSGKRSPPLNNGPGLDSCEGCSWVIDSVVTLHGVTTLAPLPHILVLSVLFSAYFSEWIKSYFLCRYFRLNAPSILFLFCILYQTGIGELRQPKIAKTPQKPGFLQGQVGWGPCEKCELWRPAKVCSHQVGSHQKLQMDVLHS